MKRAIPSPAVLRCLFITLHLAALAATGVPDLDGFAAAAGLVGVALLATGAGFLARAAARTTADAGRRNPGGPLTPGYGLAVRR